MEHLDQMSKPALIVELAEREKKIAELQTEVMKAQLVGAVRLDVIRLLGFLANRDPAPNPKLIVPESKEARNIIVDVI